MANWSNTYHWLEYENSDLANEGFSKIQSCFENYQDPPRGLKYGFASNTIIQIVSTQKWGIALDLTEFFFNSTKAIGAFGFGEDHEVEICRLGSTKILEGFDVMIAVNKNLTLSNSSLFGPNLVRSLKGHQTIAFPNKIKYTTPTWDLHLLHKKSIRIKEIEIERVLSSTLEPLVLHNDNNICVGDEDEDQLLIVLGEKLTQTSQYLLQGLVYYNSYDKRIRFDISGACQPLYRIQQIGDYFTPIEDEPSPFLEYDQLKLLL